jgi:AcrR family transcriptional regulator
MPKKTAILAPRDERPGPRDERGVLAARILIAAREAFAETGWAGTTIRAVARTAGVDPALVYHYFGSKEALLDKATDPPQRWLDEVAKTWTAPVGELGRRLLETMMLSWEDDEIGPTLRAILLTAAHEASTQTKLRRIVESSLIGVSTLGDDQKDRLIRSGLVSSQMMGLGLMRYVWKVEPVASMTKQELTDAVAPNLQRYIEQDLSGDDPRSIS